MRVESGVVSDIGLKRKSNEDNYCADDEHGLYVVADGMGGTLPERSLPKLPSKPWKSSSG